jgi:5-methylcytosine-specific restriction endonuclease McrA
MKTIKPDAEQTWKQLEDDTVPRLRLSVNDRAVYYHLLRHTRLEGKRQIRFSVRGLSRSVRISDRPLRDAVRQLLWHGVLRLIRRSMAGHVVEVRLPDEVRTTRPSKVEARKLAERRNAMNFEETDFMGSSQLRQAIHARESERCFYCMRRIPAVVRCLDHVVPRVRHGRNSYRNLVSCCLNCNSRKGDRHAADFLRWLYRDSRLTARELSARLRALRALGSGKLRPRLPVAATSAFLSDRMAYIEPKP